MTDPSLLTKTRYRTGLDCPRKMWYSAYNPIPPDPGARWRMEQGMLVGKEVRRQFPGGSHIRGPSRDKALKKTRRAVESGDDPLFEAAFLHEGMLVRADIIRPTPEGEWILTEVKSTTSVDAEEKQDVAFQQVVLEGAGLPLKRVELMHLNSGYRHPDTGDLFAVADLTGKLGPQIDEVHEKAPRFASVLNQPEPPEAVLIRECKGCDYQDRCWKLPEQSVFTLPRLHWQHTDTLLEEGTVTFSEIEGHEVLKERHDRHITAVRDEEPYVNEQKIRETLGTLEYPIHFLDFEAIGRAIPQWEGTKPWQQVPFQYSLHVMEEDGSIRHSGHLHDGEGDPRPELTAQLIDDIGETGSVVAYHTSFEKRCLQSLKDATSRFDGPVQDVMDRLWDQRDIFSSWHYIHPKQKGSTSIKKVLPALAPKFAYDDLGVQDGMEAVVAYEAMIDDSTPEAEADGHRDELLQYCKRDTRAMVEIHRALHDTVE